MTKRESTFCLDLTPGLYYIEVQAFDSHEVGFEDLFRIFYETKEFSNLYLSLNVMPFARPQQKLVKGKLKKVKQVISAKEAF